MATNNDPCLGPLVMDATRIYWSSTVFGSPKPITLYSVAKASGERQALLTCSPYPGQTAPGIAIDDTNIYWPANDPETVLRVPK
jgi:hypothetical protein